MIIRKEAFHAVLPATSEDDNRYFLHAIHAEPAKHRLVATNGHVLLIATDKEPLKDEDFPVVPGAEYHGQPADIDVPVDVVRSMLAAMPKKTTLPILQTAQLSQNGSEQTATIAATNLSAPCVATITRDEHAKFPSYERIFPSADRQSVKLAMAVDVLETLIKAAKAAVGSGARAPKAIVVFDIPTGTDDLDKKTRAVNSVCGITINGPQTIDVTGLAMPCRL